MNFETQRIRRLSTFYACGCNYGTVQVLIFIQFFLPRSPRFSFRFSDCFCVTWWWSSCICTFCILVSNRFWCCLVSSNKWPMAHCRHSLPNSCNTSRNLQLFDFNKTQCSWRRLFLLAPLEPGEGFPELLHNHLRIWLHRG